MAPLVIWPLAHFLIRTMTTITKCDEPSTLRNDIIIMTHVNIPRINKSLRLSSVLHNRRYEITTYTYGSSFLITLTSDIWS